MQSTMLAILLRVTLIFSTLANCGHFQNNHEFQVRILEKIAELDEKIQVQGDMIIKQDEKIQILQTVIMPKKIGPLICYPQLNMADQVVENEIDINES